MFMSMKIVEPLILALGACAKKKSAVALIWTNRPFNSFLVLNASPDSVIFEK